MKTAKIHDTVKVHYKGSLSNGEIFDSSEGKEPLQFTIGNGEVIPGFDRGVEGMQVDEEKKIEVDSDAGYGSIKPELIFDLKKEAIPEHIKPEIGLKLVSKTKDGKEMPLIITNITDEIVTLDGNHPLAGKDLIFDVKLVEIEEE